jgi:hypothetical protein
MRRWGGKQIASIEVRSRGTGRGCKLNRKIVANIFQKPLDKSAKVCYNINVRGKDNKLYFNGNHSPG